MKRRNFLKNAAITAIGTQLVTNNLFAETNNSTLNPTLQKIVPKRLKRGSKVGLIAPAGFLKENQLDTIKENMALYGYELYYTDKLFKRDGYLGGTDEERAEDINHMFANTEVDGIFCTRGGWGCARMLDLLDYELIKNNPKVIIGYSDVTSLLYAIYSQTGVVCYHGPVGISTFNDFTKLYYEQTVVEPKAPVYCQSEVPEDKKDSSEFKLYPIRSGVCEGELAGGNLAIVSSLVGTKYDIDLKGKILFLEEIDEAPYRVDRMLMQMEMAGKFEGISGIALGIFNKCDIPEEKREESKSFSLSEVLYQRLYHLNVPVVYGLSFGHVTNKFTMPFGIKARLDATNKELILLEKATI